MLGTMNNGKERRQYPRHGVEFEVRLSGVLESGQNFDEVAMLHDISDAGLSFVSQHPKNFFISQPVSVKMGEASDVNLEARVIWAHWNDFPDGETITVGVALEELIKTERFIE